MRASGSEVLLGSGEAGHHRRRQPPRVQEEQSVWKGGVHLIWGCGVLGQVEESSGCSAVASEQGHKASLGACQ